MGPTLEQLVEKRKVSPGVFKSIVETCRFQTDEVQERLAKLYAYNITAWRENPESWGMWKAFRHALLRVWAREFGGKP